MTSTASTAEETTSPPRTPQHEHLLRLLQSADDGAAALRELPLTAFPRALEVRRVQYTNQSDRGHNRGVFTNIPIQRGTLIENSYTILVPGVAAGGGAGVSKKKAAGNRNNNTNSNNENQNENQTTTQTQAELIKQTVFENYIFNVGASSIGDKFLALGIGSLFNHNDPPNVDYRVQKEYRRIEFFAAREIRPGEELTIFYGPDLHWDSEEVKEAKRRRREQLLHAEETVEEALPFCGGSDSGEDEAEAGGGARVEG